jgi:hypothetical protein
MVDLRVRLPLLLRPRPLRLQVAVWWCRRPDHGLLPCTPLLPSAPSIVMMVLAWYLSCLCRSKRALLLLSTWPVPRGWCMCVSFIAPTPAMRRFWSSGCRDGFCTLPHLLSLWCTFHRLGAGLPHCWWLSLRTFSASTHSPRLTAPCVPFLARLGCIRSCPSVRRFHRTKVLNMEGRMTQRKLQQVLRLSFAPSMPSHGGYPMGGMWSSTALARGLVAINISTMRVDHHAHRQCCCMLDAMRPRSRRSCLLYLV